VRRVPKRGFHSRSHKEFNLVKVGALADIEAGTEVTPELLVEKGLVRKNDLPVKILGDGEISHALEVTAHAFSRTAMEKIQKAGGTTTVIR
jgi:large subunit ribosomal protein L15